ncbi:RsmE family RNA methyltransferase [Leptospira semungkisensis]|uniref:16S rRNA (uracil(1498)-N(3))-methyltransferase n=1 Tax=Leptospira semungkisensis TaxID=2484985 RepID=A0A4R9FKZ7_9LEPT|nr:RsmE family RNA methyltransferase [Leptospira semungkisensis]TGJ99305.1 RsmE family RNA methyltransferase [Leptospira semungkisensis]
MNILLLDPKERSSFGEWNIYSAEKIDHIRNILKKDTGDSIKAGLLNESLGLFRIREISPENLKGSYTPIIRPKKRNPFLHLISSVQRPPTAEKILHLAGVWGIHSMEFQIADLSRKEYLTSPIWKNKNLQETLYSGMEQGGNIHLPFLELGFSLPEKGQGSVRKQTLRERVESISGIAFYLDKKGLFLLEYREEILKNRVNKHESKHPDPKRSHRSKSIYAKTHSTDPSPTTDLDNSETPQQEICIFLGPEPGWSKREISLFQERNIKPVRLSKAILRSEQAFSFFLSQWEACFPNL